jgi:hypothetical protein
MLEAGISGVVATQLGVTGFVLAHPDLVFRLRFLAGLGGYPTDDRRGFVGHVEWASYPSDLDSKPLVWVRGVVGNQ